MNSNPTISILMPVKNTAPFLNECLDSIINQSETDFELIAIDDHSTDESHSILNEYSIKDKRVKVFKKSYLLDNQTFKLVLENHTSEFP